MNGPLNIIKHNERAKSSSQHLSRHLQDVQATQAQSHHPYHLLSTPSITIGFPAI